MAQEAEPYISRMISTVLSFPEDTQENRNKVLKVVNNFILQCKANSTKFQVNKFDLRGMYACISFLYST